MAQYTKHNSNYIKTNIHQKLKDGSTIFERDWVTIGSQLHFGPGKIPYYTNGNFIFTTSPIPHYQKRYKNGVAVGLWTYDDVKNATNVVNKINNDEYTEDIRTYAYYGSCLELVRSSIEHIISNFPGNITVSDTEIEINDKKYYVLNNPFGIILNEKEAQLTQYDNELHYLSYSWDKYEIKPNDDEFVDITSYEIKIEDTSNCVKELDKVYTITINDSIVIEAYIYDGEIVPLVKGKDKGIVIQPKKDFIEDYFNNLQGFEKQLLTRKTTPLYSNMFITPIEYNLGYLYYKRTYTWPSNGYCIDITSTTYMDFLNKLTSMAEIYDELWTDNLWRRMTHEAIKNYDWTYTKEFEDGEEQDNIDGGERMHKVLNIIGRVFDDVKLNIDLVKRNNRSTYNGDRNMPNALLSDKLELMGWDAYSTISTYTIEETVTDENEQTIEREIPASEVKIEDEFLENYNKKEYKKVSEKPEGISQQEFDNLPEYISKEDYAALDDNVKNAYNKEYNNISWYATKNNNELTFTDVDVNFMRKMLLSSKYILKTKGTRAAIDMIMGMFGYGLNGEDYSIIETYRKVKPKMYDYSDYEEEEVFGDKIVRLNAYKENERIYPDDEVSGIPVGSFKVQTNIGDICEFTTYLIPYYDQRKMYDGDFTFQSKGGWFYQGEERWIPNKQYYRCDRVFYDGSIWRCTENNTDQNIFSKEYFEKEEEKENQFKWTETLSYLHVVSTIKDLLNVNPNSVTNGNIYYVANVNDYIDYTEETTLKSNFFVLNNDFAPDMFSSWENIDLDNPNDENAERAKYLDSIILNTLGNNPHVGFGGYDKGETYFEYMKKPFKYAIDRNFFSYEDMEDAKKILFDVDEKDTEAEKSSDKIKIFADQDDMNLDEDIIPDYRELTKVSYVNIYKNDVSLTEDKIKWKPNKQYYKGDRVSYNGSVWHYEEDNTGYYYEDALGGIWRCKEDNAGYYDEDEGKVVFSDKYFEKDFKYRKCIEYNKDAVREAKKNIYYLNSKVVYFENKIDNEQYKKYFKNVIMKYLMQVIPSTTILILQGFE